MPTSSILPIGTDDFDSNLNKVSSAVHYSSSPIKHEYEHDHAALPFGTEAATTEKLESDLHPKPSISAVGFSHDESLPTPVKKRRVESPSPVADHNAVAYGTLGFNQTFAYPAPPHQHAGLAAAFPGQSPHPAAPSNQPIQQLEPGGQLFPGQSPPFQARNGGYFVGMGNGLQMQQMVPAPNSVEQQSLSTAAAAAAAGMAQPLIVTHIQPSTTATVPYPYHINYPTGQPLIQHPNGQFYPAIMNVVSSDQRDHPNDATLLSRIVDDPPNPPETALGQPKKWIRWTDTEDLVLKMAVKKYGEDKMDLISRRIFYNTRDINQCRQRWKKALQPGLVKGNWTKEEDSLILEMVKTSSVPGGGGESQTKWSDIAKRLPGRLGEHVKARWVNHLDPDIRKG
eukprot:scaffold5233_cov145-Skeletonema_marinoi.AAC.1